MAISEEVTRFLLNLLDYESHTGVLAIDNYTSSERTGYAPNAYSILIITDRVRENEARGAASTTCGLVDMCCGASWGLVVTGDIEEGDILRWWLIDSEDAGNRDLHSI
jgi:hypothetical protein